MLYLVRKELLAASTGNTDCKTKYRWRYVDALLTLICRMWLGAWVWLFCTSRRLIRRKWTVTYQCQYFTINSSIAECDNKYETRNAEPEIGTDGSCQTRRDPRVDGYGSGFAPPRVSGLGFWTLLEPNRPVFAVPTRTAGGLPGLVANTSCALSVSSASKWTIIHFSWSPELCIHSLVLYQGYIYHSIYWDMRNTVGNGSGRCEKDQKRYHSLYSSGLSVYRMTRSHWPLRHQADSGP